MATYFIGIYWSAREETREVCAKRVATFFIDLTEKYPQLNQWYKKGNSRKSSLVALPVTAAELSPLLKQNCRDIGNDVISELGYSISAWTGNEGIVSASFAMTCGAFSAFVKNSVVISFAPNTQVDLQLLSDILRSAVAAFDPEYGVVNTNENLLENAPMMVWEAPALFAYKKNSGFLH